jgi:glycine hydroxymethyltransferase
MDQIAELMRTVLTSTTPADASKAKYRLDPAVADHVSKQATELLADYPLYPTVDLG